MIRRSLPALVLLLGAATGVACRDTTRAPSPNAGGSPAVSASAEEPQTTEAFWAWFSDHAKALRTDPDLEHVMNTISDALASSHPGLVAEIGEDGDDRLLVITADGNKTLFPAVKEVYAARPAVPGWKIVAFRQRSKPGDPFVIEANGKKLDPTTMKFTAQPDGDHLGLTIFIPDFTKLGDYGVAPYLVLDHVAGEYDVETKIGGIDWRPMKEAPPIARPLTELPAAIDKKFPPVQ